MADRSARWFWFHWVVLMLALAGLLYFPTAELDADGEPAANVIDN